MKTRTVQCPFCATNFDVGQQIGGKISFAAGAALLGAQTMKNPFAIALCGLVGLAIGHYFDTEITTACPQCGQLLKVAGVFLS